MENIKDIIEEDDSDNLEEFDVGELEEGESIYSVHVCETPLTEISPISFDYCIEEYDTEKEAHKCADFFMSIDNLKLLEEHDDKFKLPLNMNLSIQIHWLVKYKDNHIDFIDIIYNEQVKGE